MCAWSHCPLGRLICNQDYYLPDWCRQTLKYLIFHRSFSLHSSPITWLTSNFITPKDLFYLGYRYCCIHFPPAFSQGPLCWSRFTVHFYFICASVRHRRRLLSCSSWSVTWFSWCSYFLQLFVQMNNVSSGLLKLFPKDKQRIDLCRAAQKHLQLNDVSKPARSS